MRADADRLLKRLGKTDFGYHEFSGRFSDLELWPLFGELLGDPRLQDFNRRVGADMSSTAHRAPDPIQPIGARAILGQLAEMAADGRL